jgi:dCMP deaminase
MLKCQKLFIFLHFFVREEKNRLTMETKFYRPDWDHYFMKIAEAVSSRGNCIRRKVACVLVKDLRIISTGYNGTPRGILNCFEGGCPRCLSDAPSGKNLGECICCHAESNAIVQAAYHGISVKDANLYTTYSPCLLCTKMIINAGIKEVIYKEQYTIDDLPKQLLKQAGLIVRALESEEENENN